MSDANLPATDDPVIKTDQVASSEQISHRQLAIVSWLIAFIAILIGAALGDRLGALGVIVVGAIVSALFAWYFSKD